MGDGRDGAELTPTNLTDATAACALARQKLADAQTSLDAAPGDPALSAILGEAAKALDAAEKLVARFTAEADAAGAGAAGAGAAGAAPPVDLTTLRPSTIPDQNVVGSATRVVQTRDIPTGDDGTRRNIAYLLLLFLAAVILFDFYRSAALASACSLDKVTICTAQSQAYTTIAAQMQDVFTAIIGLVGSVVGFYFGSKTANETK